MHDIFEFPIETHGATPGESVRPLAGSGAGPHCFLGVSVVDDGVERALAAPSEAARTVVWSGGPEGGLFDRDLAGWMPRRRDDFGARCAAALEIVKSRGGALDIRPCARHVIGDAQTCLSFLREHEGHQVGVLLDPVALLEPEMLAESRDHLRRMFETLGGVATGVLICGADPSRAGSHGLMHCELNAGEIPIETWADLVEGHVPRSTPVYAPTEGAAALRHAFREG